MKLNLQYFAENNGETDNSDALDSTDNGNNSEQGEIDIQALADIISDKDKEIEQLRNEMRELKKSNANLLVRINSASSENVKKSFEENLLDMVGYKPRKEK